MTFWAKPALDLPPVCGGVGVGIFIVLGGKIRVRSVFQKLKDPTSKNQRRQFYER